MTVHIAVMSDAEIGAPDPDAGLGTLRTDRGNLPLESVAAHVAITGLVSTTELVQRFHNPHPVQLEATYIFPLPDRAAVTALRMTADGRLIEAVLKERGQARAEYDQAIVEGRRAAIAEEERPDVFTMRVGNIAPGELVEVTLVVVGPLAYEDGEATYRLPLVVAPRYIPGAPGADRVPVGDGYAVDTDAVPDASRITPPLLLPGFPNPVRLSIDVNLDPAGLSLGAVRSSLHTVVHDGRSVSIQPGERVNRDFILRLAYGLEQSASAALALIPDQVGDEGTFHLTVLPPTLTASVRPRDVVLLLDRSGSMSGWKMVAARRAAARIVDTLVEADRLSVVAFDHAVSHVPDFGPALVRATDRNRFRAVEFLAQTSAQGGTELLAPLTQGLRQLSTSETGRDRVLVLVTDGQVGNEDQILASCAPSLAGVRVHTVGIDQAVNAGFLGRLAAAGGGRCELVESEDRLDEAMRRIQRRIAAPLVTDLELTAEGLTLVPDSVCPARLPDLFAGVPLVVTGRFQRSAATEPHGGALRVVGRTRDALPWSAHASGAWPASERAASEPAATERAATERAAAERAAAGRAASDRAGDARGGGSALTVVWARAHLRDLEDRYVSLDRSYGAVDSADISAALEQRMVATSLRFGVLCRFTAWLAVDARVTADGAVRHRVIQPVELPAGWAPIEPAVPMTLLAAAAPMKARTRSADSMPQPIPARPTTLARGMPPSAPAVFAGSPVRPWAPKLVPAAKKPAPLPGGEPFAETELVRQPELVTRPDPVDAELVTAWSQLGEEARRLRQADGLSEYERRELLSDLGSRLSALARHLGALGVDSAFTAAVRELAADLDGDGPLAVSAEAFTELWGRAQRLLDQFATATGDGPRSP